MMSVELAEETQPIIPVAGELIVGLIAFGVLCFILMRYVFPKMEQMYQARVEAIEGGLKRAENAQAEANALKAQYEGLLRDARSEASSIRDEARAEGSRIVEELREQARSESQRIITAGNQQLEAQRAQLLREVRGELGTLSVELASKIVGESLADEARRSGTVDRFLTQLDTSETPPEAAATAGGR